jgi:hypothetical protein
MGVNDRRRPLVAVNGRHGTFGPARTACRASVAPVLFVAALSLAACSAARIDRHESSAIGSVRAILSAQMAYAANCGGYAKSLPALAAAGVLSGDLAAAEQVSKLGYRITLSATNPTIAATCPDTFQQFQVLAVPETPGETGVRYFKTSEDGGLFAATKADFSDARPLE